MTEVYVAAAFCSDGRGGNKAGVVWNRGELSREEKMAVARELGYSETAFVRPGAAAEFALEYFTPTDEVPLCGHATVASFAVLRELGLLDKERCTIETKAGVLRIELRADGEILMEQTRPVYGEYLTAEELGRCVERSCISSQLPIRIVSTGLRDILLPVTSLAQLSALRPDLAAMTALSRERDAVGVHAFVLQEEGEIDAVCRNFAPLYGIDEESATGTASCALACHLFRCGCRRSRYIFEQGREMGATSRIAVELRLREEEIAEVFVGGRACVLEKRELSRP